MTGQDRCHRRRSGPLRQNPVVAKQVTHRCRHFVEGGLDGAIEKLGKQRPHLAENGATAHSVDEALAVLDFDRMTRRQRGSDGGRGLRDV